MTLRKIIVLHHHIIPIRVLIQNKNNNTTRIPNNKKNRRKKNNSGIINGSFPKLQKHRFVVQRIHTFRIYVQKNTDLMLKGRDDN